MRPVGAKVCHVGDSIELSEWPMQVSNENDGVATVLSSITGVNERNGDASPTVTDVNHKVRELIKISD